MKNYNIEGDLESKDDFFVMDSNLFSSETSLLCFNNSLYYT